MATDYATRNRWQNRVRWGVAHHLNKIPQTCWANIVDWALHNKPLFSRDGGDIRQNSICRIEKDCSSCYCGKLKKKE